MSIKQWAIIAGGLVVALGSMAGYSGIQQVQCEAPSALPVQPLTYGKGTAEQQFCVYHSSGGLYSFAYPREFTQTSEPVNGDGIVLKAVAGTAVLRSCGMLTSENWVEAYNEAKGKIHGKIIQTKLGDHSFVIWWQDGEIQRYYKAVYTGNYMAALYFYCDRREMPYYYSLLTHVVDSLQVNGTLYP